MSNSKCYKLFGSYLIANPKYLILSASIPKLFEYKIRLKYCNYFGSYLIASPNYLEYSTLSPT